MNKQRSLSTAALGTGLAMLIAVPALGASVTPEVVAGNTSCADLGLTSITKIEPVQSTTQDGVTITVDGGTITSWTADQPVSAVLVKGGNATNVYSYPDGTTGDTDLVAPDNPSGGPAGLSHVEFCLGQAAPSPSPSPTETTTETPTPTPTQPTVQPTVEETEEESEVLGTVRRRTQKPEVLATTGASVTLAWLGVLFVVMGLALRRARGTEPVAALAGQGALDADKGVIATLALIPMLTAQQLERWGGERRPGV